MPTHSTSAVIAAMTTEWGDGVGAGNQLPDT